MGEEIEGLVVRATVCVRSEDGSMTAAVVKWTEDGFVGLAFVAPN